jgi:hypothetical protein
MKRSGAEFMQYFLGIRQSVQAGNLKALEDLPGHMADLMDTFQTNEGDIIPGLHKQMIMNNLADINMLQKELRNAEMKIDFLTSELVKIKKVMNYVLGDKIPPDATMKVDE